MPGLLETGSGPKSATAVSQDRLDSRDEPFKLTASCRFLSTPQRCFSWLPCTRRDCTTIQIASSQQQPPYESLKPTGPGIRLCGLHTRKSMKLKILLRSLNPSGTSIPECCPQVSPWGNLVAIYLMIEGGLWIQTPFTRLRLQWLAATAGRLASQLYSGHIQYPHRLYQEKVHCARARHRDFHKIIC